MPRRLGLIFLFLLVVTLTTRAQTQITTGVIQGTVTDTTVPGRRESQSKRETARPTWSGRWRRERMADSCSCSCRQAPTE